MQPPQPSIAERLIGGDRRSLGTADTIASEVLRNNERFAELFEAMLHEDPVVRVRASDAVEKLTRSRPDLLVPFRKRLIDEVGAIDQTELRRHVGQMLARIKLDPKERSRAIALLEKYLADENSSVTGPAMSALGDFAMEDAHLRRRIAPKIEKLMLTSPALAARGKKILMRFASLTKATSRPRA
jgi:HEAT repeat protein